MKYLTAYLFVVNTCKTAPTTEDVNALFTSVGIEADEERLITLIFSLEGKNVEQVKSIDVNE
jgi:large subunit ribosomal protein LP2